MHSKQLGDLATAASILPFHCDDFNHAGPRRPFAEHLPLHIIPLPLLHRHSSAATGIIPLQNKSEKEHDRCANGENHEGIDVGQAPRLRLNVLVNLGVSSAL